MDHRQSWIITKYGSSSKLDLAGSSSKLDHHWIIIIITTFAISINWCYLSILLVTGSSTEPALFHADCRPRIHVGIHLLQHLYLTMGGTHPTTMSERPTQHSHLTMGGTHPRTMSERPTQHSHLTMGGAHPRTMSEIPSTYIH